MTSTYILIIKVITMSYDIRKIQKNRKRGSFVVSLPLSMIKVLGIKKGDFVEVTDKGGAIVIRPLKEGKP